MKRNNRHWSLIIDRKLSTKGLRYRILRRTDRLLAKSPRMLLSRKPWSRDYSPPDVAHFPSMLLNDERQLLHWFGKEYVTGAGAVVDAGCFLGGTFMALAAGLHARRKRLADARVHCYDTFKADAYMTQAFASHLQGVPTGGSFLPRFLAMTKKYAAYRTVHAGDIAELGWAGGAIELLVLDVLKSWQVNDAVARSFFTALLPARGVIVHQDYVHEWCPWIHVTMEALGDHVELAAVTGPSAVFRVRKTISAAVVRRCCSESLSTADRHALMERVVSRFRGTRRGVLECCEARLYQWHGRTADAQERLAAVKQRYAGDAHVQWCADGVLRFMAR